ncbi:UbiH/UbiF/VisC/COQ6 family ubiquinone biosynthesis hydroxylase [Tropicimonas sp. TH_r6]|uniref:UbiH/UbiF/VisC/COQ6 family ubiquinone biosynthesis hydroxylase n=1 Tax=Tropicimonas sp. TH_r6 TaxID=3082085 RepID=UPI0029547333|nr:UbiH/UbiF/VisC/COQ6 family ubiquinone biosynthesis hydroxylase [Tropicimonas sp. TH_r6]MDV7143616.1 UbiH/UbiF/VisC/COQ6 family ubiquinone biosynthesis hydroxylase [Tropicimonas sp. TH_r6]
MKHDCDILIVGGGLNGPSLALAAAQAGMSSIVVDRLSFDARADAAFDGRSYALALASQRLLATIGIWEQVADHAQPILHIVTSDGRPGEGPIWPFAMHFDHGELDEGVMGYLLEDRYLRRALLEAIEANPLVTVRSGVDVVAQEITPQNARITLASGEELSGALLVGADGRKSGVGLRAGIQRTGWDYRQTALVCAVEHEQPHEGTAHQFFMPNGPLAILPLPGNRSSIVWSEDPATAQQIAAMDDEGFLAALRPRFGDFLGEIRLAGARFSYPLNLTMANQIVKERLALIGDAAQGVHPIAGQGFNQGLVDVATLTQVLAEARRRGEDIGSILVLDRHRQWRSFDRATLAIGMDTVNKLFSNDNPILRFGRSLGMAAIDRMPALRQRFIREAAGVTGDVPNLLKGKPV